jgi:hypothetical protein
MARAREELHLTVPKRFYVRPQTASDDRHVYALPSRFIRDELTTLLDSCAWPVSTGPAEHTITPRVTSHQSTLRRVFVRFGEEGDGAGRGRDFRETRVSAFAKSVCLSSANFGQSLQSPKSTESGYREANQSNT